ncbi:MAG TPA: ISL3 family transposase [Erysipelothrix sp.]|nr:ISL3 family transposase [Erysipelothrix sp.]
MSDLKNFNNFTMLKMFNLEEKHIENFSVYNVPIYKEDGKLKENILNIDVKLINQKTSCPVCTSEKYTIKGYVPKKLKHSVLKNQKCIINYKARRYKCGFCQKTFYEHNPFALGSMRYTMNTVYNVLRDLKSETETFASVAHRHDVSTNTVISIFDDYVEVTRSKLPEIICIDEVYAFKSRNSKYVCVLLDYRSQEVIDLLPSRRLEYLRPYFRNIPIEERRNVKLVSIDMWVTYRVIVKDYFPNAKCAVDKFHIFQDLTKKMTRVRIKAMQEFKNKMKEFEEKEATPQEKRDYYHNDINYYLLKKFHWLLFKSGKDYLEPNHRRRYNTKLKGHYNLYELKDMILKASPSLLECTNLLHHLRLFYESETKDAEINLNLLIQKFKVSNLEEMNEFANTLINWKREIINSFIVVGKDNKTISNAIIENRNKSIKTIKRNGNGYTNWERFRNRVMYSLNPSATHHLYRIRKD